MYILKYKNIIIENFVTKNAAKESLASREALCYMLKVNPFKLYSIKKGMTNATTRKRKKRAML